MVKFLRVDRRRVRYHRLKMLLSYGLRALFFLFPFIMHPLVRRLTRPYMLPTDHPLHAKLDALIDPTLFKSRVSLIQAGYTLKDMSDEVRPWTIMVATHPDIEGYVIKSYPTDYKDPSYDIALYRYVRRIRNVRTLRHYLKERHCKYLTAPQKWLYRVPKTNTYFLIAEYIPLSSGSVKGGETFERYQKIPKEQLDELAQVLVDIKGCDACLQNIPFTEDNKIAFIDTDHQGLYMGDFEKRIIPYLHPDLQQYARDLWKLLAP